MNTILIFTCVILAGTTALSIAADIRRATRLKQQLQAQQKSLKGVANSAELAIWRLEKAVGSLRSSPPDRGEKSIGLVQECTRPVGYDDDQIQRISYDYLTPIAGDWMMTPVVGDIRVAVVHARSSPATSYRLRAPISDERRYDSPYHLAVA